MPWFVTNLIGGFFMPPLSLLLLAVLGCWYWHKKPRLARFLIGISITLLWLLATPYVAESLLQRLENDVAPIAKPLLGAPAAIVVLGGGTYFSAPEYGADTLNAESLQRVRYAAKLQRETGLPILVTGGRPQGNTLAEAEQMQQVLVQEFKVPVKWIETASATTAENARFSAKILAQANIKQIYLVTHAWHMARALPEFQAAGLTVVAAPTAFTTRYKIDLLTFIPNAQALRESRIYFHEQLGLLWYRLKSAH